MNPSTIPSLKPKELIPYLDRRMDSLLAEIEAHPTWRALAAPEATPEFIQVVMREVYLEIVSYQPHVIEAAIAAIAQMPRSMPPRMVKAMLRHQGDEFDHGEMALRDYVALGGSERHAREQHQASHASFAVSAVWWMIARERDPFAYLGALYPFEGLTPIVSARAKAILMKKSFPGGALEYIDFHSTEDLKHAALVKAMIQEAATRYPSSIPSIVRGMERFLFVYPLPVWTAALERARATQHQPASRETMPLPKAA